MKPLPTRVQDGLRAGAFLLALPAAAAPAATATPWISGAVHPLIEPTHLGALVLLGIAAAQLGGRSRWGLPILYAALLAGGIVLGTEGAVAPMLDTVVMTAVLGLVLLILASVHVVFAIITTAIGAFALFHGVADGVGMAEAHVGVDYLVGYAIANVAAIVAGLALGAWLHESFHRHHLAWSEQLHHWFGRFHGFRFGH